jgi:intracellular septation protein A
MKRTGTYPSVSPGNPRAMLRAGAARVVRDSLLPLATFYAGWKLVGLVVGIRAATVVALAAWRYERRQERPGAVARITLGLVFLRAAVGLLSGSAKLYLAQDIVIDVLLGTAFIGSLALGRPLTAVYAREIFPVPEEIEKSDTYADIFRRTTLVWTAYFFICGAVRLAVLLNASVDVYVLVAALTGAPVILALLAWSVWHSVKSLRNSEFAGWVAEMEAK